jgi:hypothetical protein
MATLDSANPEMALTTADGSSLRARPPTHFPGSFAALALIVLAFGAGCSRELPQAESGPASAQLIVRDPTDPTCATDARVAWGLYWPHESDETFVLTDAALPTGAPTPVAGTCAYTATVTVPGHSLPSEWSFRAVDEATWVATCKGLLVATGGNQHNVVRFTRGAAGCVINP